VVPGDERTSGRDQDARPVERAGGLEARPALDPAVAKPEPRIDLDPLTCLELGPGQRLHEPACGVLTHRPFPGVTVLVAEPRVLEWAGHGTSPLPRRAVVVAAVAVGRQAGREPSPRRGEGPRRPGGGGWRGGRARRP